jgi:hypothetical protein
LWIVTNEVLKKENKKIKMEKSRKEIENVRFDCLQNLEFT